MTCQSSLLDRVEVHSDERHFHREPAHSGANETYGGQVASMMAAFQLQMKSVIFQMPHQPVVSEPLTSVDKP